MESEKNSMSQENTISGSSEWTDEEYQQALSSYYFDLFQNKPRDTAVAEVSVHPTAEVIQPQPVHEIQSVWKRLSQLPTNHL